MREIAVFTILENTINAFVIDQWAYMIWTLSTCAESYQIEPWLWILTMPTRAYIVPCSVSSCIALRTRKHVKCSTFGSQPIRRHVTSEPSSRKSVLLFKSIRTSGEKEMPCSLSREGKLQWKTLRGMPSWRIACWLTVSKPHRSLVPHFGDFTQEEGAVRIRRINRLRPRIQSSQAKYTEAVEEHDLIDIGIENLSWLL